MAALYCRGKALEWIQSYIIELLKQGQVTGLLQNTINIIIPANFITQLQTMFGKIDPKKEAKGKLL